MVEQPKEDLIKKERILYYDCLTLIILFLMGDPIFDPTFLSA
jgi:hypothetical protein